MLLTTERLLLREFEPGDWRATLAYQSTPEYLRYYPWTRRTEEGIRNLIERFIAWSRELPRRKFQLALVLKADGQLIGNCGIRVNPANPWEADIGYELDHHYWGHGYATEAARALLGFGFEELALHRIYANCLTENTASARVLERIGMRREGHVRENEWMKGHWWDTFLYAILDHEWHE